MEKEDEYAEGGMDGVRRMGEGWKKGWKEECDRWVVPGQSWEGAERLASQGERTHTNTHTCELLNSSRARSLLSGVFSVSFLVSRKRQPYDK